MPPLALLLELEVIGVRSLRFGLRRPRGWTYSRRGLLGSGALFHRRYRVVQPIKAGGAGAVYEVIDEVTSRRRALKVMLPLTGYEASLRKRFAREAKISGRIESEHVVQVLDAGIDADSNVPFIVMDLLRGEDLRTHSERRGPLPANEVLLLLTQVALALEKTHAAGGTRSRALTKVLGQKVEERLAKAGGKAAKLLVGAARLEKTDVRGSEMLARAAQGMRRWDE